MNDLARDGALAAEWCRFRCRNFLCTNIAFWAWNPRAPLVLTSVAYAAVAEAVLLTAGYFQQFYRLLEAPSVLSGALCGLFCIAARQ